MSLVRKAFDNPSGKERLRAMKTPLRTLFLLGALAACKQSNAPAEPAEVQLSTDLNPGTSPCLSMPEVLSAAASYYRLPPLAGVTAATLNPARRWGRGVGGSGRGAGASEVRSVARVDACPPNLDRDASPQPR